MKIFKGLKMLDQMFGTIPKFLMRKDAVETSKIAAHRVDSRTMEEVVYEAIKAHPKGIISDEILALFPDRPYSSITARYRALLTKGLIEDTGLTKPGKSGKPQRIMKVCDKLS
jgi:hypothetical protein